MWDWCITRKLQYDKKLIHTDKDKHKHEKLLIPI